MEARQLALALAAEDARRAALQADMEAQAAAGSEFLTTGLPQSIAMEDFDKEYEVGDEIGRGAFSSVRNATSRIDQRSWAVKIMLKQRITSARTSEQQMRRLRDELKALSTLQHPHVILLHQTAETPQELYLLMEKAEGGELFDRIVGQGHFSEPQAIGVMRQLLDVLDFMHQRGLFHRDIKPENILLTSENSWDIKVSDFGLVKITEDEPAPEPDGLPDTPDFEHTDAEELIAQFARMRATTMCGSSYYMAPEVAWRRHAESYGPAVDVWSSGVVLYILLSGRPPWDQGHIPQPSAPPGSFSPPFPDEFWGTVSAEARATITSMLTVDAAARPTAAACLQMPWFLPAAEESLKQGSRLSSSYQANMREFANGAKRQRESVSSSFQFGSFQFGSMMSNPRDRDSSLPGSYAGSFSSILSPDSNMGSGAVPMRHPPTRHVPKQARRAGDPLTFGSFPSEGEGSPHSTAASKSPPASHPFNGAEDELLFLAEE